MWDFFETIKENPLFEGIGISDFKKLISCLPAKSVKCQKNDIILLAGNDVNVVGLVLSGRVRVVKEDAGGDEAILAELSAPNLFCEVFACAELDYSPITIRASDDCEVLLMDYRKIIEACPSVCPYHIRLNRNLLRAVARKSLLLNQKVEILSKRSIRERLICFFDMQRGAAKEFTIPYNREEMARYLCVDRSAMSNEISKMQKEGLIRFNRNDFEILDKLGGFIRIPN